ncbi:MAG: hypothetical protein Q8L45_14870 [Xanthomonadaceae bacterium]|nr:hypothetical protein [Xanthomonadaceae bacterium]MDP2185334.1 hypothetical protein [Xanthomonadales bacterium]MDZ4115765.1 hypothetical protein [Xanthomonadaceae bacterium]
MNWAARNYLRLAFALIADARDLMKHAAKATDEPSPGIVEAADALDAAHAQFRTALGATHERP